MITGYIPPDSEILIAAYIDGQFECELIAILQGRNSISFIGIYLDLVCPEVNNGIVIDREVAVSLQVPINKRTQKAVEFVAMLGSSCVIVLNFKTKVLGCK